MTGRVKSAVLIDRRQDELTPDLGESGPNGNPDAPGRVHAATPRAAGADLPVVLPVEAHGEVMPAEQKSAAAPLHTPDPPRRVHEPWENDAVDPRLRPFIVAVANAIVKDILGRRER